MSSLFLKNTTEVDFTPSLGSLFQCFIILAIRQIILISSPRVQFDVTYNPTPPCHVLLLFSLPLNSVVMQPEGE